MATDLIQQLSEGDFLPSYNLFKVSPSRDEEDVDTESDAESMSMSAQVTIVMMI